MAQRFSRLEGRKIVSGPRPRKKINIARFEVEREKERLREFLNFRLIQACFRGDLQEIKDLLDKGAYVNASWGNLRQRPIICAADMGHNDVVGFFIAEGVDLESRDAKGMTALMAAAERGHTETVKLLLSHGARVNAMSGYGWSALMFAAANGRTETVRLLLENEAFYAIVDVYFRRNAMEWALEYGHKETAELIKKWKENDADWGGVCGV